MSSVYYNDHFSVGMGKVSAVTFSDSKEKHSTINPEETGSSKIAPWGEDNRYPQNFMATLKKNGAGGSSYRFLKAAHYGQGFQIFREDTSKDGKRDRKIIPIKSLTDINAFHRKCKIDRFFTEIIADLETFNLAFPEFILSNDYNKVVSIKRLQTAKMRYERINPKSGLIENAYFCHNWQSGTSVDSEFVQKIPVVDSYFGAEQIKEYCKAKKLHKFTMPIFYPLIDETYYPEPDHHSVYRNGWMDVVNAIPDYKKAYSKNQLNIKYLVKVSEEYFLRTYEEDWKKFTPEKKKEIRTQLTEAIDEHLSGNKNAGKSIQVTRFKDRTTGDWEDGITIEEIGTKNDGEGKGILDASAGNQEIMSAIGTDPNLMGAGIPGNKLGDSGGSNKREAFSILNALFKTKRETTLEPWRILRDYNGWDENLEGDFAVTNLTTLDKNPTGTQNEF